MMRTSALILLCATGVLSGAGGGEKAIEPLIILDGAGKEMELRDWKFSGGIRTLAWLAEEKGKKAAPDFLEFREEKSTTFASGILTLVPLESLKALDYDHDKKKVKATVLVAGDKETILVGSTQFANINKFNIDGVIVSASINVKGKLKLQDGSVKAGIDGLRFPSAKPQAAPEGRIATVIAQDKENTAIKVHGLSAIYKTSKGQQLQPFLMFQKTVQIDLAKIVLLRNMPVKDKKGTSNDFEVTLADGAKQGLTLLEKTALDDQPATLVGLVGRVPTGYQLFPPHTIAEIRFATAKEKE